MTNEPRSDSQPPEPDPPGSGMRAGRSGAAALPDGERLVLDQAFDSDSLYQLRAAVAAHATQAGLSLARVRDLVLAVHELAANAVRHGAGHGRLRIWNNRRTLRCQVTDDGAPKTVLPGAVAGPGTGPEPAGSRARQWGAEPGHGLWLVRQIADQASWDSTPDGTTAAVSFTLEPADPR